MYDLIVENARIYPMTGDLAPATERSLAVRDGRIVDLGADGPARERVDARGRCVLPGFIDCHTHALYAGDRMDEHVRKLGGATYEEISRAGGGIRTTVNAVRAATEEQLVEQTLPRITALVREGVTCIEIKSGYGLDLGTEIKMLRAMRALQARVPVTIVPTFLGAHAVPAPASRADYLNDVVERMLPAVAAEKLAALTDIFVEHIAFDLEDLRRVAEHAHALGLGLHAHTEQLSALGGTALAARLGALACSHLEYCDERDVAALAANGTVAVLLPCAFYFLRETHKPPVELLRQSGVAMAVATDLNPGTSPVASLLAALHMSCTLFGLTPAEALLGTTRHAARALGLEAERGSLAPGMRADFTLWDLPQPEYLAYQFGGLAPDAVYVGGKAL
jgi:imidazolonepropionase